MKVISRIIVAVSGALVTLPCWASGPSGNAVPGTVTLEMGRIYVWGSFANPDQCATSSVVVLTSSDAAELNRMYAAALTAAAANKPLSMWLSGGTPVPWYPSAPQATTVGLVR